MALTVDAINAIITELTAIDVDLQRSTQEGLGWPRSLLDDYAAKGEAIQLLATTCMALLNEVKDLTPKTGAADPGGSVVSNRSGLYIQNPASAVDRRVWYNPAINQSMGWLFVADRS